MRFSRTLSLIFVALSASGFVLAAVPQQIAFQGQLVDGTGLPITAPTDVGFTLYLGGTAVELPSTGFRVYQEEETIFPDSSGLFSHVIGTGTAGTSCDEDLDGNPAEPCLLTADDFPGSDYLDPLWLEVRIDPGGLDDPLLPRTRIVSVGFSLNSARLNGQSSSDFINTSTETQTKEGKLILNGPLDVAAVVQVLDGARLALRDDAGGNPGDLVFRNASGPVGRLNARQEGLRIKSDDARDSDVFIDHDTGNVGIGTTDPIVPLHVVGNTRVQGALRLDLDEDEANYALSLKGAPSGLTEGYRIRWESNYFGSPAKDAAIFEKTDLGNLDPDGGIAFVNTGSDGIAELAMVIRGSGKVGIGTPVPDSELHVAGTVTASVLHLTGGADIAEPFSVSGADDVPAGSLVVIDETRPGWLSLSKEPHDTRVAGVVSGAGGVRPGLKLAQQGVMDGEVDVAISGRVYALATASNGPIRPGDLLTTSDEPGRAMRATGDQSRGAVIGKAMTSLDNGTGMVLVLVNLQ